MIVSDDCKLQSFRRVPEYVPMSKYRKKGAHYFGDSCQIQSIQNLPDKISKPMPQKISYNRYYSCDYNQEFAQELESTNISYLAPPQGKLQNSLVIFEQPQHLRSEIKYKKPVTLPAIKISHSKTPHIAQSINSYQTGKQRVNDGQLPPVRIEENKRYKLMMKSIFDSKFKNTENFENNNKLTGFVQMLSAETKVPPYH